MDKVPNKKTSSVMAAEQETGNKSRMAFDILLMMSTAIIIGALAVGMFILVSS